MIGPAEGGVKALVPEADKAALSRVRGVGGRLVADRGSYLVYEIPDPSLARILDDPSISPRPDFDRIELNRLTIDTRRGDPPVPAGFRSTASGERLLLVQFAAPPVDRDLESISKAGARIIQYVPQNAYIVWAGEGASEKLRAARDTDPLIQYVGGYHPYYALSPRLDGAGGKAAPVKVTVQFFNYGPGARKAADRIARNAVEVVAPPRQALGGRYINVRLTVPGDDLPAIASLPGVVTVEPCVEPELSGERQGQGLAGNLNPAGTQPTGPGYLAWLASRSFPTLPSEYPIVDVVDDGFDNGSAAAPANSEFRRLNNPADPSRVEYAVVAPGASGIGSPNGVAGHGNINCSIVGGYNDGTGSPANVDASGYHYGLGVSPYGRIASTKVFTDGGYWGWPNEAAMISNQYTAGVRITSNSWGSAVSGDYNTDAQNYDGWARDAQAVSPGNQEMLFIFSAGNSGPTGGSIGSPGTAKNVITVGASENYDLSGTDGCGISNSDADDLQDIAWFSSRGPCDDGRAKPEIVAQGTHVHGAASYDPSYTGASVCDRYNPLGQTKYAESSGTSHSAPAVAGCASLISNFLDRTYSIDAPSPALLKACLLHAGRHLTGADANDDLPSNEQGFGLVNLDLAFDQAASRALIDQTEVLASSGETYTWAGRIDNSLEPFRAALVWTDAPGPTSGSAYVNDLDLEITVAGTLYRGNNFNLGLSVGGGTADPRNNSECVFLAPGLSGNITVVVRGTSIAGDGVPGNLDPTDQDFALVLYNASAFTPTPTPEGWRTPSPTPTVTPTPEGYRTPSPSPTPLPGVIPFAEDFEGVWSGGAPEFWSREYIWGSTEWERAAGGYDGRPPAASGGAYNARFFYDDYGPVTRLITPRLCFGAKTANPRLTFRLAMEEWLGDQDELAIYCKSSGSGPWTLLAFYDVSYSNWVDQTVELPDPSDDYYICFEGMANWGYGVCVDDVLITGDLAPSPSPSPSPGSTLPPPSSTPSPSPLPTAHSPLSIIASGDYDGDGTSDIAIFRGSSGMWAVRDVTRAYFGRPTGRPVPGVYGGGGETSDIPVSGDYDGDGTSDIAIFRPSSGLWSIRLVSRIYYGAENDRPVPGDYDGDGTDDVAIFRPSSGMWAIKGFTRLYFGLPYVGVRPLSRRYLGSDPSRPQPIPRGLTPASGSDPYAGDRPVPADYDGDGWLDIAVYRPSSGLWAIRNVSRIYYGASGDWTLPADYEGNGTVDVAIFRPSSGLWAIKGLTRFYFGLPYIGVRPLSPPAYPSGSDPYTADRPVPADFDGDGTADIGIFRSSSGLWAIRNTTRAYFGVSGDIPVTR